MLRALIRPLILLFTVASFVWFSDCQAFSLFGKKQLSQKPEAAAFIKRMVDKYQFNKTELTALLNKAHLSEPVISNVKAPLEMQPWVIYRNLFITPQRIELGVKFWEQHKNALSRAQKQFGVQPEIIVAILGVETKYGMYQGEHRVIDALATLAFTHLPRADYFKSELEEFLLLCRELKLNPLSIYGSYAGAIGQSQFMPSSYRTYAVDFAGKGQKDLRNNTIDAIGSIANYLNKHGWSANETVAIPAKVQGDGYKRFIDKNSKPSFSISQLLQNGIQPLVTIKPSERASVINLENEKATEYWLGLQNFYVITRYNSSKLYAMAVFSLSHEIKAQYQKQSVKKKETV